jgi:hypothetical protein
MPIYANHIVIASEVRKYRKLETGERICKGQLLAEVDTRLAMEILSSKLHALHAAEADRNASEKTRDESRTRHERLTKLREAGSKVSDKELRRAELACARYASEETAGRLGVQKAAYEVIAAMRDVRLHEVRSPGYGVVKQICKTRGDAAGPNADVILQLKVQ